MPPGAETVDPRGTLSELIAAARAPGGATGPALLAIASFGVAAIEAVTPLLADRRFGGSAVLIIKRVSAEYRTEAIQGLLEGRPRAGTLAIRGAIDSALNRLGVELPPLPPPPSGPQVAPAVKIAHHVVVDHIAFSSTPLDAIYLFACGRFFSEEWVQAHGGLADAAGKVICSHCEGALYHDRPHPIPAPNHPTRSTRTYVVGPVWHILEGPGADSPEFGWVYFFSCYRWMPGAQAQERGFFTGTPSAKEPICISCEEAIAYRSTHGEAPGAFEADTLD